MPSRSVDTVQEPREQHRADRADGRPDEVDREIAELAGDERRPERTRRVHRGALDRQRDQPAQRDRRADRERGVRADDAVPVGRAEDDRHEEEREQGLDGGRRSGPDQLRRRHARRDRLAEEGPQEQRRADRPDDLGDPVGGQPARPGSGA